MSQNSKPLEGWGSVAAFLIVVFWLGVLLYAVLHLGADAEQWKRLMDVRSAMEAVVFAAAGALFGTTIQRARVKDAQQREQSTDAKNTELQKSLLEATTDAAKGHSLAAAVLARGANRVSQLIDIEASNQSKPSDDLTSLARKLYPDA